MRAVFVTVRILIWSALITISLPLAWQSVTGGTTLVVTGSSMTPTYERGDIVFLEKKDSPPADFWHVGDIVAVSFTEDHPEKDHYIHRVVKVLDDGRAVLKGDGNPEEDSSPVSLSQVVGVPVFALHGPAADIYPFTQSLPGRFVIFGCGITGLLIVESLAKYHKSRRAARISETSNSAASTNQH